MNEKWEIPFNFAELEKVLGETNRRITELCDEIAVPDTPEAAELALCKALLKLSRLEQDVAVARNRYEVLRDNWCAIRIKQLEVKSDPT